MRHRRSRNRFPELLHVDGDSRRIHDRPCRGVGAGHGEGEGARSINCGCRAAPAAACACSQSHNQQSKHREAITTAGREEEEEQPSQHSPAGRTNPSAVVNCMQRRSGGARVDRHRRGCRSRPADEHAVRGSEGAGWIIVHPARRRCHCALQVHLASKAASRSYGNGRAPVRTQACDRDLRPR